jgi:hypothetical protein
MSEKFFFKKLYIPARAGIIAVVEMRELMRQAGFWRITSHKV